jgi:hypothetical protein
MRVLLCLLFLNPFLTFAQGTRADYQRSFTFADRIQQSGYAAPGPVTAIPKTSKFWYRSGNTFLTVDAANQTKAPSFDHSRLAAALTLATGTEVKPDRLPFNTLTFGPGQTSIEVVVNEQRYRIHLPNYALDKLPASPRDARYPIALPGPTVADLREPLKSPDGKSEALLRNYNIWLRTLATKATVPLTTDGSEGNPYRLSATAWSPDSRKLAVYRLRLGQHRKIAYIESSPFDQVQPKSSFVEYTKPGDTLDIPQPVLIDIASRTPTPIDPHSLRQPLPRE